MRCQKKLTARRHDRPEASFACDPKATKRTPVLEHLELLARTGFLRLEESNIGPGCSKFQSLLGVFPFVSEDKGIPVSETRVRLNQ